MLSLVVVIRRFGEIGDIVKGVLPTTDAREVERGLERSGMVRRFDLPDAIANLSSKYVSAFRPSGRAAGEENYQNVDEGNQCTVKGGAITQAVETALHENDDSTETVLPG